MSKYQKELEKIQENLLGVKNHEIRSKARLLIRVLESKNISIGCDKAGLQRRTFYNQMKSLRENDYSLHSLLGKSRRPTRSPRKTSEEIENKILALRQQRGNGGVLISCLYYRQTGKHIAASTVDKILRRNNVSKTYKRKKPPNPHNKRYSAALVHDRVQSDTVYLDIENSNGNKVYAVTFIDDCSRNTFVYVCEEKSSYETTQALRFYVEGHGKPKIVQTDNGVEFTNRYVSELNSRRRKESRISLFEQELQKMKIASYLIRPRTPQHNGKIERFHRTLKYESCIHKMNGCSQLQIKESIEDYVRYYNEERPHSSIKKLTPKEVFDRGALNLKAA